MVLVGEVDCANLPRRGGKNRRTAMLYLLEDQLPLEAERLTADFLPPVGGRVLGAAVETARVQQLLIPLTEVGIEVAALCPTALLAAWRTCQENDFACDYVLVSSTSQLDLLRIADGQPSAWYVVQASPAELRRSLEADLLARPIDAERPTITVVGQLDAEKTAHLEQCATVTFTESDGAAASSTTTEAAHAAAELLAGSRAGWIDLARGRLASASVLERLASQLRPAVALALVLLVTLAGLLAWRAGRYDRLADQYATEQQTVYRTLYPSSRKQQNVKSRLRSELTRLSAVSGQGGQLPNQASALETLRAVVGSLPPGMRLRLTRLQFDPGAVLLEGQTLSHGDAETIAKSLKRGGLKADPPSTEHLVRGGVKFTLTAQPVGRHPETAGEGEGEKENR